MKTKNFLYLGIALAFTACSSEDDMVNDGPVAAQISASIAGVHTRAADTSWETNDAIGISCTSTSTNYTNVPYTISNTSEGSFTSTTPIYFQKAGEDVTFSAYYPYAATLKENGIIEKEITKDDQESETQKNIDYMFASGATASKAAPDVKFTGNDNDPTNDHRFKHCMSKLSLTFNQGADTDLKNMTDFTIKGLKMAGTFDTKNGKATATAEQAADLTITETPASSDTYTRSLIIFPQAVTGKQFTLSLTLGGQEYSTTLSIPNGADDFTAGNDYTYTITVKKTGISVTNASIDDWNPVAGGNDSAEM